METLGFRGKYAQAASWWRSRPIVAFIAFLILLLLGAHFPILFSF